MHCKKSTLECFLMGYAIVLLVTIELSQYLCTYVPLDTHILRRLVIRELTLQCERSSIPHLIGGIMFLYILILKFLDMRWKTKYCRLKGSKYILYCICSLTL
jgi:hypothetical protein